LRLDIAFHACINGPGHKMQAQKKRFRRSAFIIQPYIQTSFSGSAILLSTLNW
jgi:hypothetical protein